MRSFLRAAATLLLSGLICAAAAAGPRRPDPRLSPAEVVRIQLDALAHNDRPAADAGIDLVWRFASPGNQAQTGPLPRFRQMVHQGYADMIDHQRATLAATVVQNGQALQGVELIDRAGVSHRYIFVLSQQTDPPYRGCWMTDGVIGSPDEKPQQSV